MDKIRALTRARRVRLIFIIPTVIVPITQPAVRDAAVVLTLETVRGAGVLIWRVAKGGF